MGKKQHCQSASKNDPQTESKSDPLRQLVSGPHLTQLLEPELGAGPSRHRLWPSQREEGRAVKAERSLRSEPKVSLDGLAAHATFGHGGENSLVLYWVLFFSLQLSFPVSMISQ